MIQKIRGTQDFLDLTLFIFITRLSTKHFQQYNFAQIMTPILEPVDLFKHTLGLETDVVQKQMFLIESQSQTEKICLRPEATASTMRAFLEEGNLATPWKVFSWGPMFRYERPQKGRFRQFHQINVEAIDQPVSVWDAYFVAMLDRLFFELFHLDSYALTINYLGCSQDRVLYRDILKTFLDSVIADICLTCQRRAQTNIMRVFDCKNEACNNIYIEAPKILDHLCKECEKEWLAIRHELEHLSVSYSVVPTLVRGLDYYDRLAFEFVSDSLGAQTAFCGGGRYDHLATHLGSKQDFPSIGAAIGIERLLLLLEPIKDTLLLDQLPPLYLVLSMQQETDSLALLITDTLHAHGFTADVILSGSSMKSMMRKADRMGASKVIMIGEQELAKGTAQIKDMKTGKQIEVKQIEIVKELN